MQGPSQLPMGLRNSQSSHVINPGKQGGQMGPPSADSSFRPGSWDNTVSPLESMYRENVERGSAEVQPRPILALSSGAQTSCATKVRHVTCLRLAEGTLVLV